MFMPAMRSLVIISMVLVLGPIVQMIEVLRASKWWWVSSLVLSMSSAAKWPSAVVGVELNMFFAPWFICITDV